jgi:tellurite resistance protein
MRNSDTRRRFGAKPAEMLAQYWDNREDELLDAVLTAVALVARADGRIDAAERSQLLDFLHRKGILTVFTPAEILETFEHRVRELNEPGGPVEALKHLRRHAEGSLARIIINAAQEVAAADRRIDPREQHILQLIWITLGGPLPRPAARSSRGGGHREPTNRV